MLTKNGAINKVSGEFYFVRQNGPVLVHAWFRPRVMSAYVELSTTIGRCVYWFTCVTEVARTRIRTRTRRDAMGNAWFGKKRSTKGVIHPVVHRVTIKVRMTRSQLQDLTEKLDIHNNGNSELGRLIVQECSKGTFHARLLVGGSLSPIHE
ncbi:hypothetical protein CR513_01435, partial [Mucuna pruriens]